MKIAIMQRADVADVRSLSGVPYFMIKALNQHVGETVLLGPDRTLWTRAIEFTGKVLARLSYGIFQRRLSSDHHRFLARRLAHTLGRRLQDAGCAVVFAPVASVEIACLSTTLPVVYYSDVLWCDIVDYYPGCSSLYDFMVREGDWIEASAISKANALVFPSAWSAGSAAAHYGADRQDIHIIPCGANFEAADMPTREQAAAHEIHGEIRLLWIGVDWQRKGGSVALECLRWLLDHGISAQLTVCGCTPPEASRHPAMHVVPFLSKQDPVQRSQLSQLFLTAHFFLFPTMAEAFGIVLCEASAHGLPSLVRDTGGVGGAISDGENGYLMPPGTGGREYGQRIMAVLEDPALYARLVEGSRNAYEERLNWDAWGRSVKPIFEQAVQGVRV